MTEKTDFSEIYKINKELKDQYTSYENPVYNPLDFYTSSGQFNLALFNKTYREDQTKRIAFYRSEDEKLLSQLDKEPPKLKLHDLSIMQHLLNIKNTWFDLINDLIEQPLNSDILLKNDRLFYIGLTFVLFCLIYFLLSSAIESFDNDKPVIVENNTYKNFYTMHHDKSSNDYVY